MNVLHSDLGKQRHDGSRLVLEIIVIIITNVSPLHLVWWFPCSVIIGLVALLFPLRTHLLRR